MPKVTMILTDRDVAKTAKIREATSARSNAHAVSIALSLTNFIVEALENGEDLLLRKPSGEFERVYMTELADVTQRRSEATHAAG
ncbi:MAG: hypothetical protein ACREFZ_03535 [Acetobacteraceae bacterium]